MSHDRWQNDEPEDVSAYLIEEETRSFWRPVLWVTGGGLAVVVVGVTAAFAWLGYQRATAPTVAQHRSPAELRSEAARHLASFDPAADPTAGLSPTEHSEREEILALFRQIEVASHAGDKVAIRKLVDVPRLFARIKQTGKLALWSRTDRFDLQMQVGEDCTPDEFWSKIQVVGIVPVADAPETRVVYAVVHIDGQDDQSEARFWVARQGRGWKVYDWERLDLGTCKSLEWAVIAWHTRAGTLGDFGSRSALLTKFNEQRNAGDYAAARKTLLVVEQFRCPPEFTDRYHAINGYNWLWLHANEDAVRCFEKVGHPEDVPGAWYGLMVARQWTHPQQALANAEKYQAALGPSTSLCETKAQILNRLGRKSEAAVEWKRALRRDANHDAALRELLVLLPEHDKAAFAEQLDKTSDPVETAASLATMIAWRDEPALNFLIDYVRSRRPTAPELASLTALKHSTAGDHAQAADSHLQILLAETDAEKQREHATRYLAAMTPLGRVVEGFEALPTAIQPGAIHGLASGYFEEESELTRDEFQQILAAFRQRHPDNLQGINHVVGLALHDQRFDDAARDAREGLRRLDEQKATRGAAASPAKTSPAADDPDEDVVLRAEFQQQLAVALCHTGQITEAWNALPAEQRFNRLKWIVDGNGRASHLNELLRLQTAVQPDDPEISYYRGRLAERENRIEEAIGEYRQGLKKSAAKPNASCQTALRHLLVEEERWREYYDTEGRDDEQLKSLAADLVRLRKWDSFDELMQRRSDPPTRARLASIASEAAWERKRFADCAEFCKRALQSPESGLEEWQRGTVRERQLAALLRAQNFGEARTLAGKLRDDRTESHAPAVVCAAAGEFVNALAIARVSAEEVGSASSLYQNAEVGGVFLRDEFADLHDKFPVEFPYMLSSRTAVVLLKSPSDIDEHQFAAIVQEAVGPETTVEVQSLATRDPLLRAYRVGVGSATVWLVAGSGWCDHSWKLPESNEDDTPERVALLTASAGSAGYLVIGISGWTKSDRERVEDAARRVARRLVGPSAVAVQFDFGWSIHAPDDTLLERWAETGEVGSRAGHRALQLRYQADDTVAANRQFQNELAAAARAFNPDEARPLEITIAPVTEPVLDPLTIRVTKVSRNYGSFVFEGVLQSSSLTVPALRPGLKVQIREHHVQAWRSGDTDFRWRP